MNNKITLLITIAIKLACLWVSSPELSSISARQNPEKKSIPDYKHPLFIGKKQFSTITLLFRNAITLDLASNAYGESKFESIECVLAKLANAFASIKIESQLRMCLANTLTEEVYSRYTYQPQ